MRKITKENHWSINTFTYNKEYQPIRPSKKNESSHWEKCGATITLLLQKSLLAYTFWSMGDQNTV